MSTVANNNDNLTQAFAEFNAHSDRLNTAYESLAHRVGMLTRALASANDARRTELLQKEQLAARLAQIIEALPALVVVTDADGVVVDANGEAISVFGQQLCGLDWAELCRQRLSTDGIDAKEICLDATRWFHCSQRELAGGGHLIQLTEVSEARKQREHRAREQRLAALGEMSARLAHQLRTPLATAMLYATQPGGMAQSRDAMLERLSEMSAMIDDLLCFAGGAVAGAQVLDTGELIRQARESAAASEQASTGTTIRVLTDGFAVTGNRTALVGALANLLRNAVQHSDGIITIRDAIDADGYVCLSVSDQGKPIDADIAGNVFEPFFTTRPSGTGLGLAIVRSVARAHGGDVSLRSRETGNTFSIRLPSDASQEFALADDTDQFAISDSVSSAIISRGQVAYA